MILFNRIDSMPLYILFLRVSFGSLMLLHGMGKLFDLIRMNTSFFENFDPFGIGGLMMLVLAVFSEFVCSLLVIAGLCTRLALIPLISSMAVAFFLFHASDDLPKKEAVLLYMIGFIFLMLSGPGKYSVDKWKQSKTD